MSVLSSAIARFFAMPTAPGVLLVFTTLMALVAVNSPLSDWYDMFINIPVVLQIGTFEINKPLLLWINDGLMAIFFLLVGLEVKREVLSGHLSSREQAILPALAAIGGLLTPAAIYAYINQHDPVALAGWAIPGATDIAFALGVVLMLGHRVPLSLKVCLMAIAIMDDLLAVIVIALFYTAEISLQSLLLASLGLLLAMYMNWRKVTSLGPYVAVGLFVWACVLKSGVHATLAGVALGLIIPLRAVNREGKSPLRELEHALHPWVAFAVVPLFAFANAGISLAGLTWSTFLEPITMGIVLGLFFGKQLGVMLVTVVVCKLRICRLPDGVSWLQFYGMALLTGIGFTMSLFIGTLAFADVSFATPVRIGVLTGSLLSTMAGVLVLLYTSRQQQAVQGARV